jgi:hypothetical protein
LQVQVLLPAPKNSKLFRLAVLLYIEIFTILIFHYCIKLIKAHKTKPVQSGKMMLRSVHFIDFVSFAIVNTVVEHGK